MKKVNIRLILISVLAIISLISFVYLNSVSVDVASDNSKEKASSMEMVEEDSHEDSELALPDLEFVKNFIERSKDIFSS